MEREQASKRLLELCKRYSLEETIKILGVSAKKIRKDLKKLGLTRRELRSRFIQEAVDHALSFRPMTMRDLIQVVNLLAERSLDHARLWRELREMHGEGKIEVVHLRKNPRGSVQFKRRDLVEDKYWRTKILIAKKEDPRLLDLLTRILKRQRSVGAIKALAFMLREQLGAERFNELAERLREPQIKQPALRRANSEPSKLSSLEVRYLIE